MKKFNGYFDSMGNFQNKIQISLLCNLITSETLKTCFCITLKLSPIVCICIRILSLVMMLLIYVSFPRIFTNFHKVIRTQIQGDSGSNVRQTFMKNGTQDFTETVEPYILKMKNSYFGGSLDSSYEIILKSYKLHLVLWC